MVKLFLLMALLVNGCVTTGDVASKRAKDPSRIVESSNPTEEQKNKYTLKIADLERELAKLKGELENSTYGHSQEIEQLKKRVGELETENADLKNKLGEVNSSQVSQTVLSKKPEVLWKQASKYLLKGRYENAIPLLQMIYSQHPKSKRAPSAMATMGMIYYKRQEFKKAVLLFNQMIDKYPKSKVTTMAWYGGGCALSRIGQKKDATLFFKEASKKFPKTDPGRSARSILRKKAKVPKDLFSTFSKWWLKLVR